MFDWRTRHAAERTIVSGAKSGHFQHAALALVANALTEHVAPGGGWMVTERWHDLDDESFSYVSSPVLLFREDGPHTPGAAEGFVEAVPAPFYVWHPSQIVDGEPMTHERAVKYLEENEEHSATHSAA
jgi:hypothetical protein